MPEIDKSLIGEFINAVVQDQPKARAMLSEYPELLEARWKLEETPLHFLAVEYFADAVRFLAELGASVNVHNHCGCTPLIDVACLGNDEIARILITFGADPNAQADAFDNVLHCAVRSGNSTLVKILIDAGAKSNYVTAIGHTIFDALPEDKTQREKILEVFEANNIKEKG